ncbi:MAG: hypothetical protein AMXMBFR13_31470 [Phycisphaerae bacterium]
MPRGRYDIPLEEERAIYEAGLAHFNAGEFFEAHEAWEDAWNGTSGRRSDFYRGLIQMAVVWEHYRRRNGLGVRKVFATARQLWQDLPGVYMGLDLREFERKMATRLADVLAAPDGAPVSVDPGRFFSVEWQYDPFAEPREEAAD